MGTITIEKLGSEDLNLGRSAFTRTSRLNPINTVSRTKIGIHTFLSAVRSLGDYITSGAGTLGDPYIFTWATVVSDLGATTGGTVEIPAGYFKPSTGITFTAETPIKIRGMSRDQSILYTPASHGIVKSSVNVGISLENLTLLGDSVTAGNNGIRIVGVVGTQSYVDNIKDVTIRGFQGGNIKLVYTNAAIIDGAYLLGIPGGAGIGRGIDISYCKGISIKSCIMGAMAGQGIHIDNSQGISMASPWIFDTEAEGIYVDGSQGITIASPYIQGGVTTQILLGDANTADGCQIEGGYLNGNSSSNYNVYAKKSGNSVISGCYMTGAVTKKVRVDAGSWLSIIEGGVAETDIETGGNVFLAKTTNLYTAGADLGLNPALVGTDSLRDVAIGATAADAAAKLEIVSTTKGLLFPRMTTAQRDAIANVAGLVIFNTTTGVLNFNNGAGWAAV